MSGCSVSSRRLTRDQQRRKGEFARRCIDATHAVKAANLAREPAVVLVLLVAESAARHGKSVPVGCAFAHSTLTMGEYTAAIQWLGENGWLRLDREGADALVTPLIPKPQEHGVNRE